MGVVSQTLRIGEQAFVLRDIGQDDAAAVVELHREIFGPGADRLWFDWKYGTQPTQGCGHALGAWHDGKLIAFYGGLPRALWHTRTPVKGLQMGDVMVHPQWRGLFSRRGLFYHLTHLFHTSRLGASSTHPFEWGYGFPNARHLKLGVTQGLVLDGGRVHELRWDTGVDAPRPTQSAWWWAWRELLPDGAEFDASIDQAWKTMAAANHGLVMGQRDATYVRWRFVQRPVGTEPAHDGASRYRFFGLRRRWSSALAGVAVLDAGSPIVRWVDWIGDPALMREASRMCRRQASQWGAPELSAWASPAVEAVLETSEVKLRVECAGFGLSAASSFTAQEATHLTWWLMAGDTDFL